VPDIERGVKFLIQENLHLTALTVSANIGVIWQLVGDLLMSHLSLCSAVANKKSKKPYPD
jgi:hypothetical protein